ncbi:type II secretion system protein [Candidatus Omnitrophota bacterium]
MRKGFSLLELILVMVVVGILAVLAIFNYAPSRERALDREARASLRLLKAAEQVFFMENMGYFISADIAEINQNLRLFLPAGDDRSWDYECFDPAGTGNDCIQATRFGGDGRSWHIMIAGDDPPQTGLCVIPE